jgi:8-oxo-dGTP diphosphatase
VTEVSAAILRREGKILICRRPAGGSCPLLWEFPGGKREPGETPEQCLKRECAEELGITVRPLRLFDEARYRYPSREVHLLFFEAEILYGRPERRVHGEMLWAAPEALGAYPFCPADAGVVEKLRAQARGNGKAI